jgi:hypothetical protein
MLSNCVLQKFRLTKSDFKILNLTENLKYVTCHISIITIQTGMKMKKSFPSILIILIMIGSFLTSFSSASISAYADSTDSTWKLNVSGLVNQSFSFTLTDLEAMPQTTVATALICVDFPNTVVAQGNWTGVRLWTLLNEVGVSPEAIKVAFYANDGYSTDLAVAVAKSDNIILATVKDGVPLNEVLRLVVPGHWGYKWIAQVVKIELVNYDFQGKWETLGYSDDGIITPSSQRDTHPFPSSPVLTTSTILPSVTPKETPGPSPSMPPTNNSTFHLPAIQSKNLNSQSFYLKETITAISIAILAMTAVALIIIIKTKSRHKRK